MKILLFHPVPLPPKDYGGVERVVLWLAKGLRDLGHEVWVAAEEGSVLPSGIKLLSISADDKNARSLPARLPPGIEVVHFHAPPESGAIEALPCAAIVTVHGNGKPGEVFPKNTVFLSQDHAMRHGRKAHVYNGIDPAEFEFSEASRDRASPLFLSKTTLKTKNLSYAIGVAKRAGRGLMIAGGRRPLRQRLRSLVFGFNWLGPVADMRKASVLKEASSLLFPIQWEEPFGLVVLEALVSGTPVIAAPRGAMRELVSEDVGALIPLEQEDSWVAAIRNSSKWRAENCRKHVLERFTNRHMAENYLSMYRKAIQGVEL